MKGQEAEDRAEAHLRSLGREILTRNYRLRGGEIDVISREPGGTVVFTEVRQRGSAQFGEAIETVHARKLALIRRAAQTYLIRHYGHEDHPCRLEVLTIDGPPQTGALRLWVVEF